MTVPGMVSVIIPALNEESTIQQAIHSALAQEGVEVEVIVVDGASADGTRVRATSLVDDSGRVVVLDNPRVTIPSGLNIGLAEARGEFIARLDAHSRARPDYLLRAVQRLHSTARLGGVGGLKRGVSDTSGGRAVALALSSRFGVGDSVNHYATRYQETDHASHGIYRTDLARLIGGWDESLLVNEDVDFDMRLMSTGHTIGYDPEMVFDWEVRKNPWQLFRQYRRYGRGKAKMIRKNGAGVMRWRHYVAPSLVVVTAGTLVASVVEPAVLLVLAPYAGALTFASVRAWARRPRTERVSLLSVPLSFLAMHYGWGLGMIEGLTSDRQPATASGSGATMPAAVPREETA